MKLLLAESHYQPEDLQPFVLIVGTPPIGFKVGYPLRIQAKRGWHTSSPQTLTSTVRGLSWLAAYNSRQTGQIPLSRLEWCPGCHPERSEGSLRPWSQTLRCAQSLPWSEA